MEEFGFGSGKRGFPDPRYNTVFKAEGQRGKGHPGNCNPNQTISMVSHWFSVYPEALDFISLATFSPLFISNWRSHFLPRLACLFRSQLICRKNFKYDSNKNKKKNPNLHQHIWANIPLKTVNVTTFSFVRVSQCLCMCTQTETIIV